MCIHDIMALESDGVIKYDHTAWKAGYISRKSEPIISKYSGRYGKGYTVDYPNPPETNRYYKRAYYIYSKE